VSLLECADGLLVLSFHLCECLVPALVEILVLHEVCLLDLFPLSSLVKDQLLSSPVEVLHLQLLYTVLCHLCLDVLAFHFALFAVILENGSNSLC
jgi:hypothetical protein